MGRFKQFLESNIILENITDFTDLDKALSTRKDRDDNPPNPNKDRLDSHMKHFLKSMKNPILQSDGDGRYLYKISDDFIKALNETLHGDIKGSIVDKIVTKFFDEVGGIVEELVSTGIYEFLVANRVDSKYKVLTPFNTDKFNKISRAMNLILKDSPEIYNNLRVLDKNISEVMEDIWSDDSYERYNIINSRTNPRTRAGGFNEDGIGEKHMDMLRYNLFGIQQIIRQDWL